MTASVRKAPATTELHTPLRRRRRFIDAGATPSCALTWTSPGQKARQLDSWRNSVGRYFARSARVLHVAWALEWLFKDGFAYATDSFLSRKLGVPVNKIQDALKALEDAGAIYRASVFMKGTAIRRIWPSRQIIGRMHPATGGTNTPRDEQKTAPRRGGTEYSGKPSHSQVRISATLLAARREAKLREKREGMREEEQ